MGWPKAARDHQTFCVSCHTALPYALARHALSQTAADIAPTINERKLLENVTRRVELWDQIGTYYTDQSQGFEKTAESRGTESVLNALILASYDASYNASYGAPNEQSSKDIRSALKNMWAQQQTSGEGAGGWRWLDFDLGPWEAEDSSFYGAALGAIAAGVAPGKYAASPEVQNNIGLLRGYLKRHFPKQSLHNRTVMLWASTKLPGLLDQQEKMSILTELGSRQRADGGWSLSSLSGRRKVGYLSSFFSKRNEEKSDGYATGLVSLVLQEAGVPTDEAHLKMGLQWLSVNQDARSGSWAGFSLNQERDPNSEIGLFMSDAATAYAVLALTHAEKPVAHHSGATGYSTTALRFVGGLGSEPTADRN
jgi:squalene-hopene/tetraprenyl-beta-curcumene cyclase